MTAAPHTADFVLRYPYPSKLEAIGSGGHRLELAADLAHNTSANFFQGTLLHPKVASSMFVLLPRLAQSRFYMPPNIVAQLIALADPVVTCSTDILRLESLSACCSAYARVDVSVDACASGSVFGKGTTNVDFHSGLRDALAAMTGSGNLEMSVDSSKVDLSVNSEQFVEKQVQLPARWLRGFAEVSAYQADLRLVHDLKKVATMRFLNNLPASANEKAEYYLVMRGGELAVTQQKQADAVKLESLSRFKVLKPIASLIDGCKIYANASGTSSWVFSAGPYRLEYVISSSAGRGFSGEGQILNGLANASSEAYLPAVRAALNWQTRIEVDALARTLGTTSDTIRSCLSKLASSGLVGYDTAVGAFFHRSLPFKESKTLSANPRLKGAKKIVDGNDVEIIKSEKLLVEAQVSGSGVMHVVKIGDDKASCTCVWYAKHGDERGPCKHVLSVRLLLEEGSGK